MSRYNLNVSVYVNITHYKDQLYLTDNYSFKTSNLIYIHFHDRNRITAFSHDSSRNIYGKLVLPCLP